MIDQKTGNQSISITDMVMGFGPIYQDATYKYFGEAAAGTALTDAKWSVSRMRISDSYVQYADSGKPTQVYTDLATVAALTFV